MELATLKGGPAQAQSAERVRGDFLSKVDQAEAIARPAIAKVADPEIKRELTQALDALPAIREKLAAAEDAGALVGALKRASLRRVLKIVTGAQASNPLTKRALDKLFGFEEAADPALDRQVAMLFGTGK